MIHVSLAQRSYLLALPLALALACTTNAPNKNRPANSTDAGNVSDAADAASEAGDSAASLPALPLHTQSRWIMDANNTRFKLAGVNWYGGESPDLVPLGLDHSDVRAIARLIKQLGFNSVRLPWALQLYEENPLIPDAHLSANPTLQGKHALEVLDAVIDALAAEGLLVILDN